MGACTTTITLIGGTSASNNVGDTFEHCSRAVPSVATCNTTCNPELTLYEGKAIIGTTSACLIRLAVDARLYHLAPNDTGTRGIADLKVIKAAVRQQGERRQPATVPRARVAC